MDIDRSSIHINVPWPEKRPRSGELSNKVGNTQKFQRINEIQNEETEALKGIENDAEV